MLPKRGVVTLVFDDGYQEVYDQIVPQLEARGLRGVFAVALDEAEMFKQESLPIAPMDKWLGLIDKGHEIASHTISHRNLTSLSDADLERELAQPKEKLRAQTLVYPGGGFDDRVAAAAAKYYLAARTVRYGFESLPPAKPMQLKTVNYSRRNFSRLKANMRALWACLNNLWLIETYHMVGLTSDKTHDVSGRDFERHLDFLACLPIANLTCAQTIKRYGLDSNHH